MDHLLGSRLMSVHIINIVLSLDLSTIGIPVLNCCKSTKSELSEAS
jgi:hypothetical protein